MTLTKTFFYNNNIKPQGCFVHETSFKIVLETFSLISSNRWFNLYRLYDSIVLLVAALKKVTLLSVLR